LTLRLASCWLPRNPGPDAAACPASNSPDVLPATRFPTNYVSGSFFIAIYEGLSYIFGEEVAKRIGDA